MRVILTLLAVAMIFPLCSKKNDASRNYQGIWELRNAEGGMSGYHEYPPGNGIKMIITEDSLFEYANNELQYARAFQLVKDTLRGFGNDRIADRLSPDIAQGLGVFFELKGNMLTRYVGIPAADGGSATYERVQE